MLTLPNLVYKGKKQIVLAKRIFFKKKKYILFFLFKKIRFANTICFFPYKLGSEELTLF